MKKCIYCSAEIDSNSVVDICEKCMYQVWGQKMANAIIDGMKREKVNGNLKLWSNGIEEKQKTEEEKIKEIKEEITGIKEENFIETEKRDKENLEIIEFDESQIEEVLSIGKDFVEQPADDYFKNVF